MDKTIYVGGRNLLTKDCAGFSVIDVSDMEQLVFTQKHHHNFHFRWFESQPAVTEYILTEREDGMESINYNEFILNRPDNATRLLVYYNPMADAKLESGSKPSDWTPAPEGMMAL